MHIHNWNHLRTLESRIDTTTHYHTRLPFTLAQKPNPPSLLKAFTKSYKAIAVRSLHLTVEGVVPIRITSEPV